MDTEKINEFVGDVTGDVAEISPDDMNNNPGNDEADNTNHDMENLAATMDNLEVGDQNDDTRNTEDMEDELDVNDMAGAAALPVNVMMLENQEISQWTTRITRAVEMSDIEADASDNPEDWGQKWMFRMKMIDQNMAPISLPPNTTVETINRRLSDEFGPGVVYFGFRYTENGAVIPANPAMTVGELVKMTQITMSYELNERYEDVDD